MSKYEKWLGAGLGFVVGGPVGGFLGFVAGKTLEGDENKYNHTAHTSDLETNLIVLASAVIRADGRITIDEINFVRQFIANQFTENHLDEKVAILNYCLQKEYDLRKTCEELRSSCTHSTRVQTIHFLFDVAIADKNLAKVEADLIFKIAGWLNINDVEFKSIKNSYSSEQFSSYHLLGLKPDASFEEIKTSYRKLVLQYHPDRTPNISVSEKKFLEEKFLQIQQAFEKIKKEKGEK
jgi:DnaJ like chaperone protein